MLEVPIYDAAAKRIGSEQLDEQLLGGELNTALLKQAAVRHQANQRQGTVAQKTRSEVEGSTRKLYRQKGTGNARMGACRTPQRRGGGRAFPRKTRDFGHDMPKAMRRLARNQAVLAKAQSNAVMIVDGLTLAAPKTKTVAALLKGLQADRGCVFATAGVDQNVYKSGRNLPRTHVRDVAEINAGEILLRRHLIFTKAAFESFKQSLAGSGKAGAAS